MSTIKLSVVIPTYNSAPLILRCLESLEQQTSRKAEFEVIVVDDGSTDDTVRVLQDYLRQTSLQLHVLHPPHAGPAQARNHGIAVSQSDWIAFLDADIVTGPDWVNRALELVENHPFVGGFEGCTRIGEVEKVTPFTHQMCNPHGGRYPTCNLILRKQLCHFYPKYEIPFREDTDLAFSVLESGYEIRFDASLVAYHPPLHPNYKRPLRDAMRYYYDGLLERRFPHRYRHDVDVHYLAGMRFPHLRRKIYATFGISQLLFLFALMLNTVPATVSMALGVFHLIAYGVVLLVHLNKVQYSYLRIWDGVVLCGVAYVVPWILQVQRWRGLWDFRDEPLFSRETWPPPQHPASNRSAASKVIPLRARSRQTQPTLANDKRQKL